MIDGKTCFYCLNQYSTKDSEHVFPDGLGGENKMMNCVCLDCNQKFSPLENELISKSFISFVRAAEAPANAPPDKRHTMKEVRTFRVDDELKVALELHVSSGLREKLVAQIILKDGRLHIRYEFETDYAKLLARIVTWKQGNLTFTIKTDTGRILSYQVKKDEVNSTIVSSEVSEAVKGYIGLETSTYQDNLNQLMFPRIFLDAKDRLKIRSSNESEALELMRHLLWWDNQAPPATAVVEMRTTETSVHHSHNGVAFNRALVKIALNCLVACYPDVIGEREKLLAPIEFSLKGISEVRFVVTRKKVDLDLIEKTHNVFFYNHKSETRIRISLYNGAFQIVFMLPRIEVIDKRGWGRMLIDHVNRKNTFEDFRALNALLEKMSKPK